MMIVRTSPLEARLTDAIPGMTAGESGAGSQANAHKPPPRLAFQGSAESARSGRPGLNHEPPLRVASNAVAHDCRQAREHRFAVLAHVARE